MTILKIQEFVYKNNNVEILDRLSRVEVKSQKVKSHDTDLNDVQDMVTVMSADIHMLRNYHPCLFIFMTFSIIPLNPSLKDRLHLSLFSLFFLIPVRS